MSRRNDQRGPDLLNAVIENLTTRFKQGDRVNTEGGVVYVDPPGATVKAAIDLLDKLKEFDFEPTPEADALRKALPFPKPDKEY